MKILIDCGGSGIKIKRSVHGKLSSRESFKPTSFDGFCDCIEKMAKGNGANSSSRIDGIAVSICGEYDYIREEVLNCWAYKFLVGRLKEKLINRFNCRNVHVVNDGDAHALALKKMYVQGGLKPESAINLSLGTSVGFGIIDWKGDLLHTCQGHNWEVGNWQCKTNAERKEQYWALGSRGLKSLEEKYGKSSQAYIHYGQRLCYFLGNDLVPIFHPKIIGISGGILAAHFADIEEGIRRECKIRGYREHGGRLSGVDIYLSHEKDFVMIGLADILGEDGSSNFIDSITATGEKVYSYLRKQWAGELNVETNRSCAIVASHASKLVCAENGGYGSLIANRSNPDIWESFIFYKNSDGSYSFKSKANGMFVSAMPNGHLVAQASKVDEWEKFNIKKVSGKTGVFTIWSRSRKKYVSTDEYQGNLLLANRDAADTWEEFRLVLQ